MAVRVVKGQAGKRRADRRARGASHNPLIRASREVAAGVQRSSARSSPADGAVGNQRHRRTDDKWKIILGAAMVVAILIVLIAACGSGGSGGGRRAGGSRAAAGRRRPQPRAATPVRDQSFRDYMMQHGISEELKQRKARIEAHNRSLMRRD